jgi:hypothetical protein
VDADLFRAIKNEEGLGNWVGQVIQQKAADIPMGVPDEDFNKLAAQFGGGRLENAAEAYRFAWDVQNDTSGTYSRNTPYSIVPDQMNSKNEYELVTGIAALVGDVGMGLYLQGEGWKLLQRPTYINFDNLLYQEEASDKDEINLCIGEEKASFQKGLTAEDLLKQEAPKILAARQRDVQDCPFHYFSAIAASVPVARDTVETAILIMDLNYYRFNHGQPFKPPAGTLPPMGSATQKLRKLGELAKYVAGFPEETFLRDRIPQWRYPLGAAALIEADKANGQNGCSKPLTVQQVMTFLQEDAKETVQASAELRRIWSNPNKLKAGVEKTLKYIKRNGC